MRKTLLLFWASLLVLSFLGLCGTLHAQSPTVVWSDSFTSTSDLNANWCNVVYPTCATNSVAAAVTCPSGYGFTLTTCASLAVTTSGDEWLMIPCFVNNTAGNGPGSGCNPGNVFNLTSYGTSAGSPWYAYWEFAVTSGAAWGPSGSSSPYAKLGYIKTTLGGAVGVCYWDLPYDSTGTVGTPRVICDEYGQGGTYGSTPVSKGTMHYLEASYASGGYYCMRMDGVSVGCYPVGMALGSQTMTDFEPGLYTNVGPGNNFTMYLSNVQICTGNWCSAGGSGASAPAAALLAKGKIQ